MWGKKCQINHLRCNSLQWVQRCDRCACFTDTNYQEQGYKNVSLMKAEKCEITVSLVQSRCPGKQLKLDSVGFSIANISAFPPAFLSISVNFRITNCELVPAVSSSVMCQCAFVHVPAWRTEISQLVLLSFSTRYFVSRTQWLFYFSSR